MTERMSALTLPLAEDVAAELCALRNWIRDQGIAECDVRLQLYPNGAWAVHSGDASYDTDHRGWWGASGIESDHHDETILDTAADLVAQVSDALAELPGIEAP